MAEFILGTHRPRWLEDIRFAGVPLMVSATEMARYSHRSSRDESVPHATGPWVLDSGGFSELKDHGTWRMNADLFGGMVTRICTDFGAPPMWCAPQDWMCERAVIDGGVFAGERFVGTHLSVAIHQELTTENLVYLRENFYFLNWIPVLQGQSLEDYLAHLAGYAAAGVDLAAEPLVGLGSVCRRQATAEVERIVVTLARRGLRLHGFGVKTTGLARYGRYLVSSDSMAWSRVARLEGIRLADGCPHPNDCRNCPDWALAWRTRVLGQLDQLASRDAALRRQPAADRPHPTQRAAPGPHSPRRGPLATTHNNGRT